MYLWTHKYNPKSVSEVQGHDEAIEKLRSFVQGYKRGAVLAYGPTGTGKTSSVYAIANEMSYEILEVNASDIRNKDKMESVVGSSSAQMSLFSRGKIILVDEIDALSGMADRGCLQALAKIIETSKWPMILIADDPWDSKLADIRKKCSMVEFRTLTYLSVVKVLKRICDSEGVGFDEEVLKALARKSGGDVRGAINDLQVMTVLDKTLSSYENVIDDRQQKQSMFDALRLVFKSRTPANVIGAFDNVDEELRNVVMWIDENLPYEYATDDLVKAYDVLSRADVFSGRIMRWQHWRYLVYINYLVTVGIALAKTEKSGKFVNYKRSSRILKLWQAKMKYAKKNSVAEKIAAKCHTSTRRAKMDIFPFFKVMFEKGKGEGIAKELELNEEEIAYMAS
ncbi:MAG: replication factor C large subunit [Candidatus Woesearchaeota archaeon]